MQLARIEGGAGTGKTSALMSAIGKLLSRGYSPYQIGFCSFTRAAREEAAARVEAEFGHPAEHLVRDGWFRTLHSVCFRQLQTRDKLLTDCKDDAKWLSEEVGEEFSLTKLGSPDNGPDGGAETRGDRTVGDHALMLWAIARSRLWPLRAVYDSVARSSPGLPDYEIIEAVVRRYERAKFRDDRIDFLDLAGRFAGWRWTITSYPERCDPSGVVPEDVRVWFFDEHQDASPLLHSIAERLIDEGDLDYVYFAGDRYQSIYGFAGSDHRCFTGVEVDRTRILQTSWRCPADILRAGERCLERISDYQDRGIRANAAGGRVTRECGFSSILERMRDDDGTWLLLARTNSHAKRFQQRLTSEGIPWDYTHAEGGYCTPKDRELGEIIVRLESGQAVDPKQWMDLLRALPAFGTVEGRKVPLLQRGVKTAVVSKKYPVPNQPVYLHEAEQHGGTSDLATFHSFLRLFCGAKTSLYIKGRKTWGAEIATHPRVGIGTIHSVKGAEADNVVILTSTSKRVVMSAAASTEARDAEHRLAYVAVTRAKRRVMLLEPEADKYRMTI